MSTTLSRFLAQADAPSGLAGVVAGVPALLLRLEGALVLAAAAFAYAQVDGRWWLFAVLFLVPDVFMLGYLSGPRIGASIYNIGHSTLLPAAVGFAAWSMDATLAIAVCVIWIAHIGFDRLVGYGLKYADAFGHTHLGANAKGWRRVDP